MTAPAFHLVRGDEALAGVNISPPGDASSSPLPPAGGRGEQPPERTAVVHELDLCGFELDGREPGVECRISVGDPDPDRGDEAGPYRAAGRPRGRLVVWDEAPYFEGARGRVWVFLFSRPVDAPAPWALRGRLPVYVEATKLTEARYQTMLAQMRRLAAGLVFDLLSPMMRSLRFGETTGGVAHRSSLVELRLLEGLWDRLSPPLLEVAREPAARLARVREVRLSWGTEHFGTHATARLATTGLDPRRPGAPRPFHALQERFTETLDTPEHRGIAGLLGFLQGRAAGCAADLQRHARAIEADRPFRHRPQGNAPSLYEREDLPRLAQLRGALARARRLTGRIRQAADLPFLRGLTPLFSFPQTPVFEHVRPYRQIREEFRRYLRSSLVLLEDGFEERLKRTQRLYEQWVFFQLAAAFRAAGLAPVTEHGLLHQSHRSRFTLDLDRGTQLTFVASDGRAVVMRYEPWVLPREMARQQGDSVYRGTGNAAAWSPDVLIEVFAQLPGEGPPPPVEFAAVVDAKYTTRVQDHHWADTAKYLLEIRSTRTRQLAVRQVWLAHLGEGGAIVPKDTDVAWTEDGPDCDKGEPLQGRLALAPPEKEADHSPAGPGWFGTPEPSVVAFVRGLLTFAGLPHGAAACDDAGRAVSSGGGVRPL